MSVHQLPHVLDDIVSPVAFERLISELSSRFVSMRAGDVDQELEDALGLACAVLGVDFAALWQWSLTDPEQISPTHVFYQQKELRPPLRMNAAQFPWYREEMREGRMIAIASLAELPPAAHVDLETSRALGIKSNLSLPLSVGGEPPVGVLSFSTLHTERAWPDALVQRLKLVAQLFTNALARRRHDLSLRESAERLSLAADAAEAGLWTLDFRTGIFWLTERAQMHFGFSAGKAVELKHLEASLHPEDRGLLLAALARPVQDGVPLYVEYRIVCPGERRARWLAMRGRPHSQTPGDSEHLMGAVIDITGRRRAEAALRKSEARLAVGVELAGLAFYELNFHDQTAFVDERFRVLGGIPPELEGLAPVRFWEEHLHPDDRVSVLALREDLHQGRIEQVSTEYRYLHPARGETWLHHVARVTSRDSSGVPISAAGVIRDITDVRRRHEALEASHAEISRLRDRLQAESDYLKAEIRGTRPHGGVVGKGPAIQKILHLAAQVAPTDSSVLI